MRKSKFDFYKQTDLSTPIFTVYGSGWLNSPEMAMTHEDWDTPMVPSYISFDKPSTSSGGSYVDTFASYPGKILSLEISLISKSSYRRNQLFQQLKALTATPAFINITRTVQHTGQNKQVVDQLLDCYVTDLSPVEIVDRQVWKYALTLTSKNPDTTAQVETSL